MTTSFNTRINRNNAFVMLLVWTFALASGIANACLLEESDVPTHKALRSHTTQDGGRDFSRVTHAQPEAGRNQDDESHTSGQPCLKVCDDSSRSLPKGYTASQTDPGPPTVVAVLWTAVAPIHLEHHQLNDAQRVVSRLPLRVRYSRLVL